MADNAVTAPGIASGQVVKSLNSLHDNVTLSPGAGVAITPSGNTLQISATSVGWSLSGNSVVPGQFLGSLNNQPLEFMVNGGGALRIEPTWLAPNLVGGDPANSAGGVMGAVIGGGGNSATPNTVTGHYGVIGGGAGNTAGMSAVVGGGGGNTASGLNSVVMGGQWNTASAHVVSIGGGINNYATAEFATVGGGVNNIASGSAATVPGGNGNEAAGTNSFAAGSAAHAVHDGTFVWGDGTYPVYSATSNQFVVQASGGVVLRTPTLTVPGAGVGTSTPLFIHRATAGNTSAHITTIDNPACNGDSGAILIVTHNYNASGQYETHPFGVWYNGSQWTIYHEDLAAMPEGQSFNVMIIKP